MPENEKKNEIPAPETLPLFARGQRSANAVRTGLRAGATEERFKAGGREQTAKLGG